MGLLRTSTSALRALTRPEKHHGSPQGCRMLAQLSQNMLKIEQPTTSRRVSKDTVMNFLLPATIALMGLSLSTFCTHQLVATSYSKKLVLNDAATETQNLIAQGTSESVIKVP